MIAFFDRLSEIGREGVSLSVSYGNNAIHLYEKFGFEVVKCNFHPARDVTCKEKWKKFLEFGD